jgi:Peptidase family M1 domain
VGTDVPLIHASAGAAVWLASLGALGSGGGDPSVPRYALQVALQPAAHLMHIEGTADVAPSAGPTTQVHLALDSNATNVQYEMGALSGTPYAVTVTHHTREDGSVEWVILAAKPAATGSTARVHFTYEIREQVAPLLYLGPEVSLASGWGTNWYPIAVDGEKKAVGTLQVECPSSWTAIGGDRASSAHEGGGHATFRFRIDHPTYFSFVAGPYTATRMGGSPRLSAYVLQPHEHLRTLLEGSEKLLGVDVDEFGPFPFSGLSLVEVPRDIANKAGFNAASLPGVIWVNSNAFNAPKIDYLLEWLGHEFTHQWFPQDVALRSPPGRYIEESIAEFGGWHAVATMAGASAAERLRRSGFEFDPIYSAAAYFKIVNDGHDHALATLDNTLTDRNIAYTKGAFVFYMLSQTIGHERLRSAFHTITRSHAFHEIDWDTFLSAIETSAGTKLGWFYEQWFDRAGAPTFELTWRQDGARVAGTITQPAPYYRATLDVGITGENGQSLSSVVTADARAQTEFALPVGFSVRDVVLDPSYKVLRWTQEYRAGGASAP